MFLDIQNKEKVCVRPTVIQVPGNRELDLSLFFERFEQKNNNMDNSFDD